MNNQTQLALGQEPTINTSGIDMGALRDEYRLSKSFVEQYTRDFRQLDDLVDGISINRESGAAFVGDTTLAGLVRSIPRNSLQQLPVFSVSVNGSKNNYPGLLCTFFLKKYAFNEDTFGKGLLSTLQIGGEQALTHGYAPFFVATGVMYSDFGTTLRLLHYMDTSPEPGISDSNESGYHYVEANLTPSRVRKILRAAERNAETTWDIEALREVLATTPRAKDYSMYESAAKQNAAGAQAGPTYDFVTRYETGRAGTIITFCPDVTGDRPLRVLENKSKWGYPRVMYLVIDPAALTPFGTSRVRLASPNQNLMNIYYGQIAAMLLLNSKPPILKRGRFLKPVELKRGAVWETQDQNATAELKNMDNGALEQFTSFATHFATQMMNIMGGQTQSAPAVNKFSKTAPGVQQAQNFMDINTNQITKILENFLRQYALVALDTMLSEQEGTDRVIVDDETKNSINQLAENKFNETVPKDPMTGMSLGKFVPPIGDNNEIEIEWEKFYAAIKEWSVEVIVSLTPDELKDRKRADLQDMLVVLAQNAQELGPEAVQRVQDITDMLLADKAPLVKPIGATSALQPPINPNIMGPAGPAMGGGVPAQSMPLEQ